MKAPSRWISALFISAVGLAALEAAAQGYAAPTVDLMPDDVTWKPTATTGVQMGLISGKLTEPGLYILRMKIAPDVKLKPHIHPDVRNTTVLSGNMYFGFGESFEPEKMKAYPPGAIIAIPANTPHYVWAKDGEVIVQDVGLGPTGTGPIKK